MSEHDNTPPTAADADALTIAGDVGGDSSPQGNGMLSRVPPTRLAAEMKAPGIASPPVPKSSSASVRSGSRQPKRIPKNLRRTPEENPTPPQLPLIGFVPPTVAPTVPPGSSSGTANLATGYEPKAKAPALLLPGAQQPRYLQDYGPRVQRRRMQIERPAPSVTHTGSLHANPQYYYMTPPRTPRHTPPATGYQTPMDYEKVGNQIRPGFMPSSGFFSQLQGQLQSYVSRMIGPVSGQELR